MKIALIYGTAAPAGRLSRALEVFDGKVRASGAQTSIIDLAEAPMPFAGMTPAPEMAATLDNALARITGANSLALFAPIYRAAPPGALKNFLDLLPVEALENKPVALISMGASPHHYLANPVSLGPVLNWFGAIVLPGIYLMGRSFQEGALTPEATAKIDGCARSLVEATRRLSGLRILPRPLAASSEG
ncbi:MAG: NAD(P)H-dependent oxidoreductase [Pararhodobacter sp.]|nr:NAD(P)H-dependent oxidoreductase [Pararhodobacter sp.]